MKSVFDRFGVFQKLLFSATILVLGAFLVATGASRFYAHRALNRIISEKIGKDTENIVLSLDQVIEQSIQLARAWSIIDIVAQGLEENDNKLVQEFVTPVVEKMNLFSAILVVRPNGKVFAYSEKNMKGESIDPRIAGLNLSSSVWFEKFAGNDTLSSFLGNLETDPIDSIMGDLEPSIEIVIPIKNFLDERIGYFLVHLPANKLTSILERFVLSGKGSQIDQFPVLVLKDGSTIVPDSLGQRYRNLRIDSETEEKRIEIEGEPFLVQLGKSRRYGTASGQNWSVISFVRESLALEPVRAMSNRLLFVSLSLFPFICVLVWVFAKQFTRPISVLAKAMAQIEKGDYETPISVPSSRNSRDELIRLQNDFESMRRNVSERTKEISDIMKHVKIGLMTIDGQGCIGQSYSRETALILKREGFGGSSLPEILYPSQPEKQDLVRQIVELMFQESSSIRTLQSLLPDEYIPYSAGPDKVAQYLKVMFEPIRNSGGKCIKLMLTIEDSTRQLELAQALKKKEAENSENLAIVCILIEQGVETFHNFSVKHLHEIEKAEQILDKGPSLGSEEVNILMRIFHTLKGDSSSFKLSAISAIAHEIEYNFKAIQRAESGSNALSLAEIRHQCDLLRKEIKRIVQRVAEISGEGDQGEARGETKDLSILVPLRNIDYVIRTIKDVGLLGNDSVNQSQLIELIQELRKVPCRKLFVRFPRMIIDLARHFDKKVNPIVIEGHQIKIDTDLLDKIGDALVHILRNSVDHGIEKPGVRLALGKEESGNIRLAASVKNTFLEIVVTDDGAGIDLKKLEAKIIEKKILSISDWGALDQKEKLSMIFYPGLSTKDEQEISQVSGRGVGMDVVKTSVMNLGGTVDLDSEAGKGLRIVLRVPLSAATETV